MVGCHQLLNGLGVVRQGLFLQEGVAKFSGFISTYRWLTCSEL